MQLDGMQITLTEQHTNPTKTYVYPVTSGDQVTEILNGFPGIDDQAKVQIPEDFQPENEDSTIVYALGKRLILQGIKAPAGYKQVKHAFQVFGSRHKAKLKEGLVIDLKYTPFDDPSLAGAMLNGISLSTYQLGIYKTGENGTLPKDVEISLANAGDKAMEAAELGLQLAETQKSIFDLVNAAPNYKTPQMIADWAVASGKKYGYKVTVFDFEEVKSMGMHALMAVNRGSEHPAKFLVLEYNGNPGSETVIGLVGKGVLFDTGGLSIKPSRNMHYMKSDMGGAAAVLGTVEMAAKQNLDSRILGFVPLTDNSVGSKATKPGDVISSYSGKSIEVIDTDAEGRLILADALAYAVKNYNMDYLIDLATLTGSAVRTFGNHCAAMFSHNTSLVNAMIKAGQKSGERVWQLPLWEEYGDEMKSDVADIRNLSITPAAGAITAAKFLEAFVNDHPAWMHLDIAGTAFNGNTLSKQYSATAYGIALLFHLIPTLQHTPVTHEK